MVFRGIIIVAFGLLGLALLVLPLRSDTSQLSLAEARSSLQAAGFTVDESAGALEVREQDACRPGPSGYVGCGEVTDDARRLRLQAGLGCPVSQGRLGALHLSAGDCQGNPAMFGRMLAAMTDAAPRRPDPLRALVTLVIALIVLGLTPRAPRGPRQR